jgi:hypothetical protein
VHNLVGYPFQGSYQGLPPIVHVASGHVIASANEPRRACLLTRSGRTTRHRKAEVPPPVARWL